MMSKVTRFHLPIMCHLHTMEIHQNDLYEDCNEYAIDVLLLLIAIELQVIL